MLLSNKYIYTYLWVCTYAHAINELTPKTKDLDSKQVASLSRPNRLPQNVENVLTSHSQANDNARMLVVCKC